MSINKEKLEFFKSKYKKNGKSSGFLKMEKNSFISYATQKKSK
ncbi:MAG: hypothetical protein Q9M89_01600 [Persephonella sp.]|nr:hypothetical protein [Persephonella sp.]